MTSPYWTAEEAAEYLGLMKDGRPNTRAFRNHLSRHPVRVLRLGARCRYHADDIKALIEFSHMSTDRRPSDSVAS